MRLKDRFVDVIRNLYSDTENDEDFDSKDFRLWIKMENNEDELYQEAKLWHDSAKIVTFSKSTFPGVSIEPLVESSFTVEEKNFLTLKNNLLRTIYIEVGASPEFFYNLRNYD